MAGKDFRRVQQSQRHVGSEAAVQETRADRKQAALDVLEEMEDDPILSALIETALCGISDRAGEHVRADEEDLEALDAYYAFLENLLGALPRSDNAEWRETRLRERRGWRIAAASTDFGIRQDYQPQLVVDAAGIGVLSDAAGTLYIPEGYSAVVLLGVRYEEFAACGYPGLKRIQGIDWGTLREGLTKDRNR